MKSFRQTIQESSVSDKLDKLAHNKPLSNSRLKQLTRKHSAFEDIDLDRWQGYPPPRNSSQVTTNEIHHLISLSQFRDQSEKDIVMHDKKIITAFREYLDKHELEVDLEKVDDLLNQSNPILLSLKRFYKRPRPYTLAKKLGLELSFFPLKTAETASYPSGHATQGRLAAKLIADEVPSEHRRNLLDIGERIGHTRQIAGAHFASDTEFGHRLGDELYRLASTGKEPELKLEDILYESPDLIGGDEDKHAVELTGFIDDSISSMSGEIALDPRDKKHNGSKVGVQIILPTKERIKYATAARAVIKSDPDLTLHSISGSRSTKDFAFEHEDLDKYVYVNTRPDGKSGGGATADPNELMTAALCTLTEFDKVNTVEEMDALIEKVKGIVPKKVEGYTSLELEAMDNDYGNLAQAVSAARIIIKKGYGGGSKVYLTAKAWHDDVSGFKRTKYGMKDFNASDFIIKKGDTYIGISLKKKKSAKTVDPTIINNSLYALLRKSGVDGAPAVADDLELAAGEFYILIVKAAAKLQWKDRNKKGTARKAITKDGDPYLNKSTMKELGKSPRFPGITTKNWKTFVQRIPNEFINNQLSTNTSTILKPMADAIVSEAEIFANILLEIIIKSTLKELKSVNFEYALVTGVGRMLKSGLVVEKGSFLSVDVMATKLDELFKTGKANMSLNLKKVQAFDKGATAAIVHFDLNIGTTKIADLQLRYKGNFQSAPSFQAQLSKEFKEALK